VTGRQRSCVNGYELNRLYDLTDPEDETLREILVESCPIPYSTEDRVYKNVHGVYDRVSYIPTALYADGKSLARRLPPHLTAFHTRDIKVGGRVAAIAWYVGDRKRKRTGGVDVEVRNVSLSGSGIQLVKNNVPIGPKNILNDPAREHLLKCFIGEVHVVSRDLQPNASGQDLRMGTARDAFIKELRFTTLCMTRPMRNRSDSTLKKISDAARSQEDAKPSMGCSRRVIPQVSEPGDSGLFE
jgi:hypothetical protein